LRRPRECAKIFTVLLVLFALFVFAVVVYAVVVSVRAEQTGAARLGVLTAIAVGGAVGAHGSDGASAAEVVCWAIAAMLGALMLYAFWRARAAR
jgi:lipopolysaccharide export LptBFGC system permease protein LptF